MTSLLVLQLTKRKKMVKTKIRQDLLILVYYTACDFFYFSNTLLRTNNNSTTINNGVVLFGHYTLCFLVDE